MPDPDPEGLPVGGYPEAALSHLQGRPDAPRCHVCNGPRSTRPDGTLVCRICDGPPLTT